MPKNQLFFTETLTKRTSVFDPVSDKVLVIHDKNGNYDLQYLLPISELATGAGIFVPIAQKGQPNGVATLDASGLIPLSQLPPFSPSALIDDLSVSLAATWSSSKINNDLNNKANNVHANRHIVGGADIIDGDNVEISYVPTNYTRSAIIPEAFSLESLSAHLFGIDSKLATVGQIFTETRTLTPLEAANRQLTLANLPTTPNRTNLFPQNGIRQFFGTDYTISGNLLLWNGLGLDGILSAGDVIFIQYS